MNKLYPEKGLRGFLEENSKEFKKISRTRASAAARRYEIVEKIPKKTKRSWAIPLALTTFLFYPYLAEYVNPVFYGLGFYVYMSAILRVPEFCRDLWNRRIFWARYRIGKMLGLISKDCEGITWKDYYKYDYGKEPPRVKKKE